MILWSCFLRIASFLWSFFPNPVASPHGFSYKLPDLAIVLYKENQIWSILLKNGQSPSHKLPTAAHGKGHGAVTHSHSPHTLPLPTCCSAQCTYHTTSQAQAEKFPSQWSCAGETMVESPAQPWNPGATVSWRNVPPVAPLQAIDYGLAKFRLWATSDSQALCYLLLIYKLDSHRIYKSAYI